MKNKFQKAFFLLVITSLISCIYTGKSQSNKIEAEFLPDGKAIIYEDTVFTDSVLIVLKSNRNYLIKINEQFVNISTKWSITSNGNQFEVEYNSKKQKFNYTTVKFQKDISVSVNLNVGTYYWENKYLHHKLGNVIFKLNGYFWESIDNDQQLSFESDSLNYDGNNLTFGRNMFTLYRINYISNNDLKFLEGSYISIDETKHRNISIKPKLYKNVLLVNDNYKHFTTENEFNYFGFVLH